MHLNRACQLLHRRWCSNISHGASIPCGLRNQKLSRNCISFRFSWIIRAGDIKVIQILSRCVWTGSAHVTNQMNAFVQKCEPEVIQTVITTGYADYPASTVERERCTVQL